MTRKLKGFTLIEVLVVIAVMGILLTLSAVNFIRPQQKIPLELSVPVVVSDIKAQQFKSMVGDSEGLSTAQSFGIYFESTRYTLFRGSSYSTSEPANYTVDLDGGVSISNITLPSSTLIFSKLSGEVVGFVNGSNTLKLNSRNGESKTISINKYGTVTVN